MIKVAQDPNQAYWFGLVLLKIRKSPRFENSDLASPGPQATSGHQSAAAHQVAEHVCSGWPASPPWAHPAPLAYFTASRVPQTKRVEGLCTFLARVGPALNQPRELEQPG